LKRDADRPEPAVSEIRVVIPADVRFLRVARLTAAGIAGDLGFGLRDLEDLRVAVDELCAVLIEGVPSTVEIELRYVIHGDRLEIDGRCLAPGGRPDLHPVAVELLGMTADSFEVSGDEESRSFRLVKRRHDLTV
jgi:serine/threonine-protein kinase RsbW